MTALAMAVHSATKRAHKTCLVAVDVGEGQECHEGEQVCTEVRHFDGSRFGRELEQKNYGTNSSKHALGLERRCQPE